MRVLVDPALRVRHAHDREQIDCPLPRLRLLHTEMVSQHFADLIADGDERVERRHGILEHHRRFLAAHRPGPGAGP